MFQQISRLVAALYDAGALRRVEVVNALVDFAEGIADLDYRSQMLGELSIRLAILDQFDKAEHLARSIESTEKSGFLLGIAKVEMRKNMELRALQLFSEAREAAQLHRFPTQQAISLAEIAQSLGEFGKQPEANDMWDAAVELARKAQHRGGTDGPEAAGVLLSAVEAFCQTGRVDAAKSVAGEIVFESLRQKALAVVSRSSSPL